MPGMAWVTKWSAEVKAGVFSAVFDHGLATRRAWELAQSGELPQLKPGEPRPAAAAVPLKTVQDWVRHERARRHRLEVSRAAPAAVLGDTIGRLAAVLEREVARAERLSARGQLKPERMRELARAGLELQRLAAAAGKTSGSRSNEGDESASAGGKASKPPAPDRSWLEGLADETDA